MDTVITLKDEQCVDENQLEAHHPEAIVADLDLSSHTKGSWPSSKNVSQ